MAAMGEQRWRLDMAERLGLGGLSLFGLCFSFLMLVSAVYEATHGKPAVIIFVPLAFGVCVLTGSWLLDCIKGYWS